MGGRCAGHDQWRVLHGGFLQSRGQSAWGEPFAHLHAATVRDAYSHTYSFAFSDGYAYSDGYTYGLTIDNTDAHVYPELGQDL